jgi:asparagine synthase (glutamine-hydrolysing)
MCGIFCLINNANIQDFRKLKHRGPDHSEIRQIDDKVVCGFHRLSIIGTNDSNANQPFENDRYVLICNGEIFNYKELIDNFLLPVKSESDCEVILHLITKFKLEDMLEMLDGEFAFILYDKETRKIICGRDPIGVRPLFVGFNLENDDLGCIESMGFASEAKGLSIFKHIEQIPAGHISILNIETMNISLIKYFNIALHKSFVFPHEIHINTYKKYVQQYLTRAVHKRLMSNVPIGTFLSGGLDSSLITALAYKKDPTIHSFSIGLENSVDVIAAKKVVEHIGMPKAHHHIVNFTVDQGLSAIRNVIYTLETYDVTTIRASIPQYLLSKYIRENTNIRVLLSGEGADELFSGYIYSKCAPSPLDLRRDCIRLLTELIYFDNLRTDRTTAAWGLEVRAPFLDKFLVRLVLNGDPILNSCYDKQEKLLLRESFSHSNLLPSAILYRPKEAFSDAVSSTEQSWYMSVVSYIDSLISEGDVSMAIFEYPINPPLTKEALFYRRIFDEFFPKRDNLIPHYWMPRWQDPLLKDPSATVLPFYNPN